MATPLGVSADRQGGWNPSAMIDLCTGARAGSPEETLARRLQRLEMQLLAAIETAQAACAGAIDSSSSRP